MADSFICIDIGETYVKVADAKKNNNLLEINNLGFTESNNNFFTSSTDKTTEEQAAIIDKLIRGLKITKKNVNIVIPDSYTYSQIVEMPKLNEKELISAIKYQADQFIPMPIDEINLDVEIIYENPTEKKLLVLMVASSKTVIEKVQKAVELAGLIPDSLENELSATSRLLFEFNKNIIASPTEGAVIINMNLSSTSLYFFDPKSFFITMIHNFNVGYSLFYKELLVNFGLDKPKAVEALRNYSQQQQSSIPIDNIITPVIKELSTEIKKFISGISAKYQIPIKKIFFINEVNLFPFLPQKIETVFTIPTLILNPINFIKKNPLTQSLQTDLPLFISTYGGNLR